MRRLALAVAVAMASGRVYALGLGDIKLHSALNEPLDADVRLLAAQPGELDNAVVRLAPNDEFARVGIERPAILSDLKFTIVSGKAGTAMLHITSSKPIREPFLDFLVQLSWQSGRLLREYTLLLDPPVFSGEKKAPVTAPAAQAVTERQAPPAPPAPMAMAPSGAQTSARAAVPGQAPQNAAAVGGTAHNPKLKIDKGVMSYGTTQRNDTLWSIASELRPDDSVSVYQMMLALLKENPQAFYDNNVNGLKAGYVLRVPDKATAMAIDEAQAVREAARQDQQWRQDHGGGALTSEGKGATPAPKTQSGSQSPGAQGQDKEGARLRLVAPGDVAAEAAGTGGVQKELDKLRGELAIAMESSDSAKREGDELRSRVATLEGQINSLQRLLTLKDQALNDLQQRSGMTAAQPKNETNAPQMEVPAVAPVKPVPAKPAPAKSAAPKNQAPDMFSDTTLMAEIAGAAVLLLAVLWLIMRRRRNGEEAEPVGAVEETIAAPDEEAPQAREEFMDSPAAAAELGDIEQITQVAEEVAHEAEPDIPQTASDLDVLHTSEGDIDPIVEADVYLAYRRYQQAESLIQSALAKQPDRQDLQAKLLEIYYAAKNADAFQGMAESLYENLGSDPENEMWQRILPMGRELCPDHVLFGAAGDAAETLDSGMLDDQVSAGGKGVVAGVMESFSSETAASAGEESFDLDLGGGQAAGSDLDDGAEATAEAAPEGKMEFDLNLGGESGEESMAAVAEEPAAETQESLSTAPELGELATTAEERVKETVDSDQGNAAAESEGRGESWEIEPAVSDFGNIDFGLDDGDLLAGTDVVGTKLDLARAYIDMGDNDSARDILTEVIEEGNAQQKQEAQGLVEKIA